MIGNFDRYLNVFFVVRRSCNKTGGSAEASRKLQIASSNVIGVKTQRSIAVMAKRFPIVFNRKRTNMIQSMIRRTFGDVEVTASDSRFSVLTATR